VRKRNVLSFQTSVGKAAEENHWGKSFEQQSDSNAGFPSLTSGFLPT